jgi:Spy/CpxP family protein refolding chaperone
MRAVRIFACLTALLALTASAALGPVPLAGQEAESPDDPLERYLYPPELIMQHRRAIDLTDEQRDAISGMIQELQGRVVSLQWELLDEVQSLSQVLRDRRVDLDRAQDVMGRVMDKEEEIKRAHLELLVRIKNLLTPDQQAELDRIKATTSGPG